MIESEQEAIKDSTFQHSFAFDFGYLFCMHLLSIQLWCERCSSHPAIVYTAISCHGAMTERSRLNTYHDSCSTPSN